MGEQRLSMKTHSSRWSQSDEVQPSVHRAPQRGSFLIGPTDLKYTAVSPG